MTKILGLDLGTNSIGWAIVDDSNKKIVDTGVRIFEAGVVDMGTSKEMSKNATRRESRQIRRQIFRTAYRKNPLLKILKEHNLCPIDEKEFEKWIKLNPYVLRHSAISEPINMFEFGRICFHLTQRRGFLSSRKFDEDGTLFTGKKDSETIGINETQQKLNEKNTTLGDYFYSIMPKDNETFSLSERIRNRYTTRDMYVAEFDKICEVQQKFLNLNKTVVDKTTKIIGNPENKRNLKRVEYLKSKNIKYNILVDKNKLSNTKLVIEKDVNFINYLKNQLFYQRPLKSQKALLGKCSLESVKMTDKTTGKTFTAGKNRCSVSHPDFELFRTYQFVNNIRYGADLPLDKEQRQVAVNYFNSKDSKFKFLALKKKLKLDKEHFNYEDELELPANYTIAKLTKLFEPKVWQEHYNDIWHCFFTYKDNNKLIEKLSKNYGLKETDFEKASKIRLKQDYASISIKAINNILGFLKQGFPYHIAVILGGIKNAFGKIENENRWDYFEGDGQNEIIKFVLKIAKENNKEGEIVAKIKEFFALNDDFGVSEKDLRKLYHHSQQTEATEIEESLGTPKNIRNPIVMQSLFDLRKVVNNIIKTYGRPDEIKIELARDLKQPKKKRMNQWYENREREKENEEAKKEIAKFGLSPTRDNIHKYILFKEIEKRNGTVVCPYTGKSINITDLLSSQNIVQIEHIVPYSRSLDDSLMNKTLCFSEENQRKGEKTPFEYYGNDETNWKMMSDRAFKLLPYLKAKRFVNKKQPQLEDFISRQLNDTRYISKEAKEYLKTVCPKITVATGGLTADLRHLWGLNTIVSEGDKKDRSDHRHHAIDALAIACIKPQYLNELSRYTGNDRTGSRKIISKPWESFYEDAKNAVDKILISHKFANKVTTNVTKKFSKNGVIMKSQGISARGQLHKETVYGLSKQAGTGKINIGSFHIRKPIESIETEKQVLKIVDSRIKQIIVDRINFLGGYVDKDKKIPKETFYVVNPENKEKQPQIFLPNKNGEAVPVRKVRMAETIGNAVMLKPSTNINQWVNPRNNHHVVIYENHKGEMCEQVVTFWEVIERKKQKQSIFQLPSDGKKIITVMQRNELFLLGITEEAYQQFSKDNVFLSKHLYKVQKLAGGDYFFELCFKHHLDSRSEGDAKKDYKFIKGFGTGITGWYTHNPIKVTIDELGRVIKS